MKDLSVLVGGIALLLAGSAPAASVNMTGYDASGAIEVANPDPDKLVTAWKDREGREYRATFDLTAGNPLLANLESRTSPGGSFASLAKNVDPRFRVTLGSRVPKTSWPYIFFERIDTNQPPPVAYLSELTPASVTVTSESANRVKIVFSGLKVNRYAGELECTIYNGSPFLRFQAAMTVTDPWVSYIFDALFYANISSVAFRDQNNVFQTRSAAQISATEPGTEAAIAAKHRTILAAIGGGTGTLAAFAPPHTAVYPTDFSNNYGFVQAGKTFFGTRMSPTADLRYRPWIDAPEGATQKMDVFLLLSLSAPQQTLATVLTYTNGDVYKSIPGYYTLAVHFHPEFTLAKRSGGNTITSFKQAMKAVGVQIVQPLEFHGGGHTMNNTADRLSELRDMYQLMDENSDASFLFIPGEEYNNFFGGHWSYMFPKPVYFTGWSGQGGRAYKQTNVVSNGIAYPTVYQIGDAARMLQLLRDEGGVAWASHPRVKGSRTTPDSYVDTDFYRDPLFQVGGWKAMPADFSRDRLGYRSLQLMDETAQWGYRKYQVGETDTFEAAPTHELYGHLNINYLQLPAFPSKTDWSSVVECIRNGRFFNTTGEVLIHSWTATKDGVQADVEWYFPPSFAEITWGDADGIHKLKKPLKDMMEFGREQISIDADLSNAKWVRFEFWDVARNGAFTQPHWFSDPANPAIVPGAAVSFTLMNADTDAPVPGYDPIPPGAVLNRSVLPANLTIRANTSPLIMDKVVLKFDSTIFTRTDWPYCLSNFSTGAGVGDCPAFDLAPAVLSNGSHTLTATPYRGSTAGRPLTIDFTVTGVAPPAVPTGLTATAGNHEVALAWQAASGAESYNIKRASSPGGPYETVGTSTSPAYIDKNLKNGVPYFYVVSAVGSSESANSPEVGISPARNASQIVEHFGQGVTAGADVPAGTAPGWHAVGKSAAGTMTDYTSSILSAKNSPNIADNTAGADGTSGYYVVGQGTTVNPVLTWVDTATSLQNRGVTAVSFFTRNGSSSNRVRVAVRIADQWYVTNTTFSDSGGNSVWMKQNFLFTREASQWRTLNFSTLAVGPVLTEPLPGGRITGVGVLASISGEKVRIDEFAISTGELTAFQLWQLENYGSTTAAEAAPDIAPGNDGVTNRLRYALNIAPTDPPLARLPALDTVTITGSRFLALAYRARTASPDVDYAVEVSGDLMAWNSGASFTTWLASLPIDAETERVTVRDNVPLEAASQRFMRLKVSVVTD